jgi:drug/metabolite transporter (DMT)-like permease
MVWQVAILGSAVIKTGYDLIVKNLLKKEHASEVLLNTYLMTLPFFIFFIFKINFNLDINTYLLIILRSLLVVIGSFFLNKVLKNSDISVVAPFLNLSPVFVIIVSYFMINEVLTLIEFIGVTLLILGSFFIRHEKINSKSNQEFVKTKYFGFLIITLIFWAIAVTLSKPILQKTTLINTLFLVTIFSIFFALIIELIEDKKIKFVKDIKKDPLKLIGSSSTNFLY